MMNINSIARWEHVLRNTILKILCKYRIMSYKLFFKRRPWCYGYSEYKEQYIHNVIYDHGLMRIFEEGKQLPTGYGFRLDERVLEIPWVLTRLKNHSGRLLDAGSSMNHKYVLNTGTIANYSTTIMTLSYEGKAFPENGISYVYGDLRNIDFRDNWFDVISCVSTIEHIGMDNSMYINNGISPPIYDGNSVGSNGLNKAISELKRVLKPGGTLYITFPFGRYENHGYFQQFDTKMTDMLITAFGPTNKKEIIFRYDPSGWVISDRDRCAQCEYFNVHKSKYFDPQSEIDFPPDYTAGVRAVACLELEK